MTTNTRGLFDAKHAENAQTTQYTAPTGTRVTVDKFTGTNTSGATATLTVNVVGLGGLAGNSNILVQTKAIAAGEAYLFPEIVGHVINAGGFLSTLASAADSIVIRLSGREHN